MWFVEEMDGQKITMSVDYQRTSNVHLETRMFSFYIDFLGRGVINISIVHELYFMKWTCDNLFTVHFFNALQPDSL